VNLCVCSEVLAFFFFFVVSPHIFMLCYFTILKALAGICDLDLLLVCIIRFSCHRHDEIYH
jgi:hypothetical protein